MTSSVNGKEDVKDIVHSLSPVERDLAPHLSSGSTATDLMKSAKADFVTVMRGLEFLSNKGAVTLRIETEDVVQLDTNGKTYLKSGLPERRFLTAILKGPVSKGSLVKDHGLSEDEVTVAIGLLKRRAAIEITRDKDLVFSITPGGKQDLEKESLEEAFLKQLPLSEGDIKEEKKYAYDQLIKRKGIIKRDRVKTVHYKVTPLGKKVMSAKHDHTLLERVTPGMLKTGGWRDKEFRRFDITSPVPKVSGGRRHFVKQAEDYARSIWLEMGFCEMSGPIVNTSFWNFDALFTAQDHPVRDLQDTFYMDKPEKGKLPDKRFVEGVKHAHEDGGKSGSSGWGGSWDPEEAQRNVLRTHTTVLSSQTLSRIKEGCIPAKYFSFGRCFRNEAVDWSHLFEFNQTEGIVIDENANFTHLLGYLKEFFRKMGFDKARFRPAHFPYTEPSVEIDVYHPGHKKWIELGGAGMFRPEVTVPLLGREVPVLAWGPGFDRIIMDYYKLKDLRDLYRNNLDQMRQMKAWMR
ncbi:MAG: phenylalanine--tRNA ligase subunit alpha [archaeon]